MRESIYFSKICSSCLIPFQIFQRKADLLRKKSIFQKILAGGNHRERERNKIRELEKVNDVCLVIFPSDVSELCVFRMELGGGWCRQWPPNIRKKN
jgi:hypothetical protein